MLNSAEVMVDYPNASALDWREVVTLLTNPDGTCWHSTVSGECQVHTGPALYNVYEMTLRKVFAHGTRYIF